MNDLELFEGWRESSIDWVLEHAVAQTHISETLVVAEGSVPAAIHIVAHGLYAASLANADGSRQELGLLSAGAVFGEMAWLERSKASANVRAVETSESLVLPLQVLEHKLSADGAFASEFMGSLARLLARRLRATNARLMQQSRVAAVLQSAEGASGGLQQSFVHFKELVSRFERESRSDKGVTSETTTALDTTLVELLQQFEAASRALEAASPAAAAALGARVQAEFLPYLLATGTALRFYTKPRGYAGDFQTIEHIYDNRVGGNSKVGERIDEVFMQQAPSMAVRNRRGVLRGCIQAAVEHAGARGERARIMSLACGPARELMDVFDQTPRGHWPVATLLDIDAEALKLVGQSLAQRDATADGTLVQANLIRLALGREKLELPPQQLIYSIGLIDYFNDEFVIRLLDWVHERLAPGGEVVLGNFHPRNPVKATMDHILEWKLIHRSEDDMQRLFAASRFGGCSRVIFEEAQVNLFAVGQRAT